MQEGRAKAEGAELGGTSTLAGMRRGVLVVAAPRTLDGPEVRRTRLHQKSNQAIRQSMNQE
eukprot:2751305-Pyramimonas_sp.AAC.2